MTGIDWLLCALFAALLLTRILDAARRPPGTSAFLVFTGKQGNGPRWYFWVVLAALILTLAASPYRDLLLHRGLEG